MIRILCQSDRDIVMEYLERNHIETTFLIGNVLEFGLDNKSDVRRCGDYYGYFEGETLRGIICFYNLGSCIPHFEKDEIVEEFVNIMRDRDFEFLLGMNKVVKPLYDKLSHFKKAREYDECSYFINNSFKPFTVDEIVFKNPDEIDENEAIEFVIKSYREGFNTVRDREDVKKALKQRAKEEDYIFAVRGEKIVAQACIQTFTDKINQIGGVVTLAEERGKGYCKAIVSELCKRIIERGKTPTLSVRKNNTPAVRAYKSVGFSYYDDYLIIKF
jgi:ribosomal protein S18 acetylase RimI-like enzyme